MKKYLFVLCLALVAGCGSSKNVSVLNPATPLSSNEKVEVIGVGQKVPDGYKLLGHVKIGDTGFSTKCNYDDAIADAQTQARALGGNLLHITKHTGPTIWSTCHRIEADVYLLK